MKNQKRTFFFYFPQNRMGYGIFTPPPVIVYTKYISETDNQYIRGTYLSLPEKVLCTKSTVNVHMQTAKIHVSCNRLSHNTLKCFFSMLIQIVILLVSRYRNCFFYSNTALRAHITPEECQVLSEIFFYFFSDNYYVTIEKYF